MFSEKHRSEFSSACTTLLSCNYLRGTEYVLRISDGQQSQQTSRFTTIFTRVGNLFLFCAGVHALSSQFFKIYFNILFPSTLWSSERSLSSTLTFLEVFPSITQTPCVFFSPPPPPCVCVSHASHI